MKRFYFIVFTFCSFFSASAEEISSLDVALNAARVNCLGISARMDDLKKMAGINTAVTAVGTVAGVGATASGIVKANVDDNLEALLQEYKSSNANNNNNQLSVDLSNINKDDLAQDILQAASNNATNSKNQNNIEALIEKEKEKSKTLGNVRTGLLATGTVSNIAGAVIASKNNTDGDLGDKIQNCIDSINVLKSAKMQDHITGKASDIQVAAADRIISACGAFETADLSVINNRADGAKISSAIGAVTGFTGTVTSGVANSNKDFNDKRRENLNTASNILSGATTAASLTATVFNATQINAIKNIVDIADECEEALK